MNKYLGMVRICFPPLLGSEAEFVMAGAGAVAMAFNLTGLPGSILFLSVIHACGCLSSLCINLPTCHVIL